MSSSSVNSNQPSLYQFFVFKSNTAKLTFTLALIGDDILFLP